MSALLDPLVAQILEQSSRDLAHTTNTLLDNYKHQADTAEATIDLIRERIDLLLNGQWMPTSVAIEQALYPSEGAIKARMGGAS